MNETTSVNQADSNPLFGLLIPKLQELKPMELHFALYRLKNKMEAVESIGSGIHSNVEVMKQILIDYDNTRELNPGSIDTHTLDGLLTSVRMHTDRIGILLNDVTESFNIHDVGGGA